MVQRTSDLLGFFVDYRDSAPGCAQQKSCVQQTSCAPLLVWRSPCANPLMNRGLWVSPLSPPSLAPGPLGHSAKGVCPNLAPKSSTDFFLSLNCGETHQLCSLATVHTHTNSAWFDRLIDNPLNIKLQVT